MDKAPFDPDCVDCDRLGVPCGREQHKRRQRGLVLTDAGRAAIGASSCSCCSAVFVPLVGETRRERPT